MTPFKSTPGVNKFHIRLTAMGAENLRHAETRNEAGALKESTELHLSLKITQLCLFSKSLQEHQFRKKRGGTVEAFLTSDRDLRHLQKLHKLSASRRTQELKVH